MSIQAAIHHLTHYKYDRPVKLDPQIVRLKPAPHSRTRIISHSLKVTPSDHFVNYQQDIFGNWLARFVFPEPVKEFKIEVDMVADMTVYNPFDFFVEDTAEAWPFSYPEDIAKDLKIYLEKEPVSEKLVTFMKTIEPSNPRTIDFLVNLNARLSQEIGYLIRMEPGVQTPEETLTIGTGSCRDTSWLLVQILRNLGLAARFVSGYLIQLKPDLVALDGPAGTDHDFTDLHAWVEVYLPGAGWVGLDPTSGLLTGESHVPLAATPHYRHAAPISGVASFAEVDFNFDMSVTRISEHPRITKPFSDDSWNALNALGHKVDAVLKSGDVRLTMGGEPTFVSIDDFESEEWNTAAVGSQKRALADKLIRRLRERFAPSGFLHYGQGKWYPGETLPRWTFSLYWRQDGKPIWSKDTLISAEDDDHTPTLIEAEQLLNAIAENLGVTPKNIQPAFEDPAEWIMKEGQLPPNVTPQNSELKDPEERARLSRVFNRGLDKASSFVLPIQRWQTKATAARWQSEIWKTRRGYLFLVPGDSPAGYRLPLGSLPHVPESAYPFIHPTDPAEIPADFTKSETPENGNTIQTEAEPEDPKQTRARFEAGGETQERIEQEISVINGSVRTAITVEPRDGKLCVFMPPVEKVEDYLELVAAVESAAEKHGLKLHIEGYAPPNDPRLNVIRVAPDPGVIEVNVHPAADWDSCVNITETVYEEARKTRLGADKFMTDGKHTGTGGGNHVVVGGATPYDSPFLRRPDLLKSLILHWQRHPSMSYLFSGLFIGPTSQAPRIDEARHDGLYELEIALSNIPVPGVGTPPQPWLLDRLLRNLLTDVTGNTHRSEICIDKLFSPDGPTGRLGLVEFRGFEMPPNPRMSLAQQLLIRALIARYWDAPLEGDFVRWGTTLSDRFMLPDAIWSDFKDVLSDLRDHGFDFRSEWYEAQKEFRFPFCGAVEFEGVKLEVRQALEAWHVLGETGAIGGTARYTDSSTERLQVKFSTDHPERYIVTCNQRQVPLKTSRNGPYFIGGVRFKAWKPSMALHPTIPVQAPLTFDIYDRWTGRPLGGCVYHVAHPGGRSYETFPVNANEAEARRLARFETGGHSSVPYTPLSETPHPEFPMTLDLRRPIQM